MRRAVVAAFGLALAAPTAEAGWIFIGNIAKEYVDIAIDDCDPQHVVGAMLRPQSEPKTYVPRMTTLRLLTGTRNGNRFELREWTAPGQQSATIVARLKQNFYFDGTWTPAGGRARALSSWTDARRESAFMISPNASAPALERLHDDLRAGRWNAATFDAQMACAIAQLQCAWLDALPALAAGREPPRMTYEPWRPFVLQRAGAKAQAIEAARQLCEKRDAAGCHFWIDLAPQRVTVLAACKRATVACERLWGADAIALVDAAWHADWAELTRLLARGANPNAGGEGSVLTALQAAAIKGSLSAVRQLIERGADPNRRGEHHSALFDAVDHKRDDMAVYLIDHGAKIDNGNHEEILWHAAFHDLRKTVHRILESGADPNGNIVPAGSPLTAAVDNRNAEMVAEILAHGADPNVSTNHSDGSPIDHARRTHQAKILRMLLAARPKSK